MYIEAAAQPALVLGEEVIWKNIVTNKYFRLYKTPNGTILGTEMGVA